MSEPFKKIIETIVIAAILIVLAIFLLPMIPGLPSVVLTIVVAAIVLLASFHIIKVLGWW